MIRDYYHIISIGIGDHKDYIPKALLKQSYKQDLKMEKKEITFPNGNKAQLVAPPLGICAVDIIKALDILSPKALILLIGGAAGLHKAKVCRLLQLYSRSIARIAADTGAIIMDGGTQAGVMAIMGKEIAKNGFKSPLLGVAPVGKVTYPGSFAENFTEPRAALDPNHTHFVLVDSREWGGETATFFALADCLAAGVKVVTILMDGGPLTKKELLASVGRGWPIIVVAGSGRLADEIAELLATKPDRIEDQAVAEIIADGNFHSCSLKEPPEDLERLLLKELTAD